MQNFVQSGKNSKDFKYILIICPTGVRQMSNWCQTDLEKKKIHVFIT